MELVRQVSIVNDQGMHARPCHAFVSTALKFRSSLQVILRGQKVNGKSILELMTLNAALGAELELRARGEDAEELLEALETLITKGFGE